MPLRRTQRSDGRQRPRWKDGSHGFVESTHANESRCDEIALEPNRQTEPLVTVPPLLERSHENKVSTRDRPARTGADARIEESAAMGEVRLALRPYGRQLKLGFRQCPITYFGSTGQRNTLVEYFCWTSKVKRLAWTLVQSQSGPIQLCL